MRMIGIALLMILTTSCQTTVQQRAICRELRTQEIVVGEKCAINIKKNFCRCFLFDINQWKQVGDVTTHDLEYCDGVQGFRASFEAVEVRPKVKALYRLKENLCQ